jgi:DNA-binding response OmpR family regulator
MPCAAQAILIVEGDRPTLELYRRELSRDFQVFTCDGERGVFDLLRTQPIAAVVLDPALPDGRGWALLAALCHAPDTRSIPIILCSALDERRRGLELGATVYLVKPVLPAALLETVRQVIQSGDA